MAFEYSILAAFGAMVCWGIGDFLIQRSTRKFGNVEALAFIGTIGSIGLLPFILQEIPLLNSIENLAFLIFIGLFTFLVAMLDFEALKQGKLSVVDVILEIELPITVLLGIIFFRETLSMQQIAFILLALFGIMLIAVKSFSKKNLLKKFEKGALIAFAGAVGMGLLNFFTSSASKQISPLMAIWFPWVIFTAVSVFYLWKKKKLRDLLRNASKYPALVFGMGIFDTLAWIFFAFAVVNSALSITIAITESYAAIAVILGVVFNRERISRLQLFGAAIALAASFALGLIA